MHRLRTCAARLRPLTASQAAQTLGQPRTNMAAATTAASGTRTFLPIRCYTAPVASEPFLNGTSSNYVEEMYIAWLEDPKSVHKVRGGGGGGAPWCPAPGGGEGRRGEERGEEGRVVWQTRLLDVNI